MPVRSDTAFQGLRRNRWFAGLPAALRSALLAEAELRHLETGEWLYGTGDAPRGVFAVLQGAALVYVALPRGDDVLVHVSLPGEIFGHAARLGRGPRLATVLTAAPSSFLYLSESALERVAQAVPEVWSALTALLYQQHGELLVQLARHLALPARARLAGRLLQLSRAADPPDTATLPQTRLAELLGVSRKTVNGLLSELAGLGVVAVGHRAVRILDRPALAKLARAEE